VLLIQRKKNEKRSGGGKYKKEKRSKVCGASSNSNTICINVHNRHDFYFIVSPSKSQITSIITKQKEKNKQNILLPSQLPTNSRHSCSVAAFC